MTPAVSFQTQHFNLSGLHGISDETLEMHFKLYEGYVKETNNLTEKLEKLSHSNGLPEGERLTFSELTRRLGFEYNGMVLHEYYFGNLKRDGGEPEKEAAFVAAVERRFPGLPSWCSLCPSWQIVFVVSCGNRLVCATVARRIRG